jgi:hypothetical protein
MSENSTGNNGPVVELTTGVCSSTFPAHWIKSCSYIKNITESRAVAISRTSLNQEP